MEQVLTLPALFLAAFVAATPVPANSEIAFVAALVAAVADPWLLVAVAGLGNTLGSVLTYAAGRGALGGRLTRLFRLSEQTAGKAEAWFARYGRWALLLSWAPGGDLLCLLAGAMRLPLLVFVPLVALAKTVRYAVLAVVTGAAAGWVG